MIGKELKKHFKFTDMTHRYCYETHARAFLTFIILGTGTSLSEALLFEEHGENTLCTKIVLNVRNNPGLSMEFSCIELVIQ